MSFFRDLRAYTHDNPKGYWFKAKLYGWGWMPVTWQGWLSVAVYIALIILLVERGADLVFKRDVLLEVVIPSVLLTAGLILLCWKTGERPRWQWGPPRGKS